MAATYTTTEATRGIDATTITYADTARGTRIAGITDHTGTPVVTLTLPGEETLTMMALHDLTEARALTAWMLTRRGWNPALAAN